MTSENGSQRYSGVAVFLHWTMALLIAALLAIGWYMVDLPRGPQRGETFALHKSIGLTVFALLVVRVLWRALHPPPPLPADYPAWRRTAAGVAHLLLYVLLVLQPLTGYLSTSFSGYSTSWFGLIPLPDWGHKNPPLNELFSDLHELCALALVLVVALHTLGALRHLLRPGDRTFRRMWFGGRRSGAGG